MAFFQDMPFHEGEAMMQTTLRVPRMDNPTVPTLSPQLANHLQVAPLIAIGTCDPAGRPWTTLWGNGDKGFARPLSNTVIGIRTPVTGSFDPVVEELVGKEATGEIVKEEGQGRMVSGLTIDLETRKRVKLYGRMIAGALSTREDEATESSDHIAEVQLVLNVEQSLGNCPKYLNKKHIVEAVARPRLLSDSAQLPQQALDLLAKADLFFISSSRQDHDMDTNHRGGPPGFMRLLSNNESGAVLVYPEYSGNRLYQTLGNLSVNPRAGICVPDFETGDMLYCTGNTDILVGDAAADLLPRSNLAVKFIVTSARFVAEALPFRGRPGDRSPYNPNVRFLASEKALAQQSSQELQQATLLRQTKLTPTISRFTFALEHPASYQQGQYVTLDLSAHLDIGYSHMRDDDPRSLNDDFVRTFTVSNPPPAPPAKTSQFDITIRRVGVATGFLFNHLGREHGAREELSVDVRGFGGEFAVRADGAGEEVCFVAAGIGITPLLPALATLDATRLHLLWSVRREDVPLVSDVLAQYPGLKGRLTVFMTDVEGRQKEDLEGEGARVEARRMREGDLRGLVDVVSKFYLCASVPMRTQIMEWLPEQTFIFEDFNF